MSMELGLSPPRIYLTDAMLGHIHEYVPRLKLAAQRAWIHYREIVLPALGVVPDRRLQASATHALLWKEIDEELGGCRGVRMARLYSRRLLAFPAANVVLQVKKLRNGRPSNYPTKTAQNFNRQQIPIPGLPPAIRVTLGYELNALGTELEGLALVVMDGDCVAQRIPLMDDPTLPLPFATDKTEAAKPRKLRAKRRRDVIGDAG